MKQTVVPTITSFARSRAWNKRELWQIERVARYAVRRAMGMDFRAMRDHHISDDMLYKAAGWDTMKDVIRRLSLQWVGHVARMPIHRRPKQMLFGWWAGKASKKRFGVILQPMWLRRVIREAGVPGIDWFRLAQDRKGWRKLVNKAFPTASLSASRRAELNAWHIGLPLPGTDESDTPMQIQAEEESNEGDESDADGIEPGREGDTRYDCPVCQARHKAGNQLQFHYDAVHSIRDPDIVTVLSKRCELCRKCFARNDQLDKHKGWKRNWSIEPVAELCEAKAFIKERRDMVGTEGWLPFTRGPPRPPPEGWWIATDGSGQEVEGVRRAGWGVGIWRIPIEADAPEVTLYGPVLTEMWDHRWIGAREKTNNTGELSAIAEGLLWVINEAPDNGTEPVLIRYDSEYAANIAQGRYDPASNEELAAEVKKIAEEAGQFRVITYQHVYGHTGEHDNEVADRLADRGAKGEVSPMSRRWAAPRGEYEPRIYVPPPVLRVEKPGIAAAWAKRRAAPKREGGYLGRGRPMGGG